MSYESDCNDYAPYGDPQRNAMDCEEYADLDPCVEIGPCIDCGAHGLCECWRDELDLEDQLDCLLSDVCPICGDHDPYACECGCNDDAAPFLTASIGATSSGATSDR